MLQPFGLIFSTDVCRGLRRSLASLKDENEGGPRVFAVLTDTLSTLANFAPSKDEDPSVRGVGVDVKKLFHPFIQVPSQHLADAKLECVHDWKML